MQKRCLLSVVILFSSMQFSFAQSHQWTISGEVKNAKTGIPLQSASVFISNSTKGDLTDAEGKFLIPAMGNGSYNLIISFVGYETQVYPVVVADKNAVIAVSLKPAEKELAGVVINLDKGDREQELKVFRTQFLGSDKNAKQTTIANEDKILLQYDAAGKIWKAHSKEMLLITNEALGYTIRYLLKDFLFNKKTGDFHYIGYPLFSEMKTSSSSQEAEWKKNRAKVYESSLLRFYRALGNRNLNQQGYLVGSLVKLDAAAVQSRRASTQANTFYLSLGGEKYEDTLYWPDIPYYQLMSALPGKKYRLSFPGYMSVDASTATGSPHEFDNYKPGKKFSVISLRQPVLINEDGLPEDPSVIQYFGYWTDQRISDLLPFDYKPDP